jgi:hypothetical protein
MEVTDINNLSTTPKKFNDLPGESENSAAEKAAWTGPTKRHLRYEAYWKIEPYLLSHNVTPEMNQILQEAISQEEEGFMGYHGSKQDFRIYQDMIRFGLEEVLQIPIRPDFHFLRIPGDPDLNVNSASAFLKNHPRDINDDLPLEAKQLLSMNMSLYGNYKDQNQFSVYFFARNTHWGNHTYNYEKQLIPFFKALGIDPAYIHGAFSIAKECLPSSGVLLQIFDSSENYQLADSQTYLAKTNGKRHELKKPISHLLQDPECKIFPQFRYVMNNQTTLNPHSPISMKRYDLATPQAQAEYEKKMRSYFHALPVDKAAKNAYADRLHKIWDTAILPQQRAA